MRADRRWARWVGALWVVLSTTGCEAVGDGYCHWFANTRYCCERSGGVWNAASRRCDSLYFEF